MKLLLTFLALITGMTIAQPGEAAARGADLSAEQSLAACQQLAEAAVETSFVVQIPALPAADARLVDRRLPLAAAFLAASPVSRAERARE